MNGEITKDKWKAFCDELSRERCEWKIMVQILNQEIGVQILNESLPFAGLTFEEKNEQQLIELTLGNSLENHQAHRIFDPAKLFFWSDSNSFLSTLDIVDENGTTTLITFYQPETVRFNQPEKYRNPENVVSPPISKPLTSLLFVENSSRSASSSISYHPEPRLIKRFG